MESKFHHIALLSVVLVLLRSHAAAGLSSEDYWKSVLPNSQMPKPLKDLLPTSTPDWLDEKATDVGVSKGGVDVNTPGTNVGVGKGGVDVDTGKGTNVGVGKGGVTVGTGTRKGKPVYVGVTPGPKPFLYLYAASDTQLRDNPNVALFFLEKDLHSGRKMNLQFTKTTNKPTFLPRQVADSIPFSSKRLPEILNTFSINPSSDEAGVVENTIKECEGKGVKGEEKLCATSLESMVDFATSKLGKDVKAISTYAGNEERKAYTITGVRKMPTEKALVICHRQEYAYAVFYCHKADQTTAYQVTMAAADGTKAAAAAVCHQDTAAWNPKHLAFRVLKVKPGSVPVCHFLPEDHILWVPKY